MRKTIVISEFAPPRLDGISILLSTIFKRFPPQSICLLSDIPDKWNYAVDGSLRLDCKHYCFKTEYYFPYLPAITTVIFSFLLIPILVIKGLFIIHRENIGNILTVNGMGPFFISALIISLLSQKPLYVYLFDLYSQIHNDKIRRIFARLFEKPILRNARKVFVTSERAKEYYVKKYNIEGVLLPHPVDVDRFKNTVKKKKARKDPHKIVFAGQIRKDNDCLISLIEAINEFSNVQLHLYISVDKDLGIDGKNVFVSKANRLDIPGILDDADILYLPMAFHSSYSRDVVATASPSKTPEYLLSKTPILVHAPEYSYVSYYARKYRFAKIVNTLNPQDLKSAITLLLEDTELRNSLVSNALQTAKRHDASKISKTLKSHLQN